MIKVIQYIWQLPQNLLGLLVKSVTKAECDFAGYHCWKYKSGLSLGRYIFINGSALVQTAKHEEGHQKQSLYLGWLYLPVIGLPSLLWATMKHIGLFKDVSYYAFYTEKWADRLGGVVR